METRVVGTCGPGRRVKYFGKVWVRTHPNALSSLGPRYKMSGVKFPEKVYSIIYKTKLKGPFVPDSDLDPLPVFFIVFPYISICTPFSFSSMYK